MVSFRKAGNIPVKCFQGTGGGGGELRVNVSRSRATYSRGLRISSRVMTVHVTKREKGCLSTHTPLLFITF